VRLTPSGHSRCNAALGVTGARFRHATAASYPSVLSSVIPDSRSAQFVNARLPLRHIPRPPVGAVLDRSRAAVGTVGRLASRAA
jgi:hypothetical protein